MFNFFKMYNRNLPSESKVLEMKAMITSTDDNRFAIVVGGQTIGTYARRRDATRGATRKGYTVLETTGKAEQAVGA